MITLRFDYIRTMCVNNINVNRKCSRSAYGMGIYAIMLPSSGFSVAHCVSLNAEFINLQISA